MADMLARLEPARLEPVPTAPARYPGVTIMLSAPASRYSLRARDPALLAEVVGRPLPAGIGEMRDGFAQLGPDEYYAVLPQGSSLPDGAEQRVSITDISERAVGFDLDGPSAAAVLMSGCPLDLALFAVGRTTRTVYETVEIIVTRSAETAFHVEVWRSFAPWLWTALTTAAEHAGPAE